MPHKHNQTTKGCYMEKKFQTANHVFRSETINPDNSRISRQSASSEQVVGGNVTFYGSDNSSILHRISKQISSIGKSTEMATFKISWALLNLLGFPIYIYTCLLAIWDVDQTKQWVLLFVSIVFAAVKVYHYYQNAQSKKLDNDAKRIENNEKLYQFNKSHQKDKK